MWFFILIFAFIIFSFFFNGPGLIALLYFFHLHFIEPLSPLRLIFFKLAKTPTSFNKLNTQTWETKRRIKPAKWRQSYFSVKGSVNIALKPCRGIKGSNRIPKQGQRSGTMGDKQIPFITFAHNLQSKEMFVYSCLLGNICSCNFWQYLRPGLLIRCKEIKLLYFPNKQLIDENITIFWM